MITKKIIIGITSKINPVITKQKNKNYINSFEFVSSLNNVYSKEDLVTIQKHIKKIQKEMPEILIENLQKKSYVLANNLINILKTLRHVTSKNTPILMLSDNAECVSRVKRKKIKNNLMKQNAYQQIIADYNNIKIKSLENSGTQSKPLSGNIFKHTRDIILSLTGVHTRNEAFKVKLYSKLCCHLNTEKLINKKLVLLSSMNDYIYNRNADINGTYTKKELCYMKKLMVKYDIYNKALISRGIDTKNIESIIFNHEKFLSNKKVGDYINNLGLVIDKREIFDISQNKNIDVFITRSSFMNNYTFKMYKIDSNIEEKIKCLTENFNKIKNNQPNNITKFLINNNLDAEKIIKENFLISEITCNHMSIDRANTLIGDSNCNIDKITSNKNFIYIENFINHNAKRYQNAGTILSKILLGLLPQNETLLIKAQPIKTTRSPLALYVRYGFKTISKDDAYIEKLLTNSKTRLEYIEPIWMYAHLNNFSHFNLQSK